jgi:hypothetical protein
MAATLALTEDSIDLHSLPVRENPDLSSKEKETHIQFSAGEETAHVESEIGSHMRRFLKHPHFTLTDYRTSNIDSKCCIVRVNGLLSVGCISVTSTPRKNGSLGSVVSDNVLKGSDRCSVDLDHAPSFGDDSEDETTIRMAKDLDSVRVWSSENGISNRLDAHPECDGKLPVGYLTVKSKSRKTNNHASVVTSSIM